MEGAGREGTQVCGGGGLLKKRHFRSSVANSYRELHGEDVAAGQCVGEAKGRGDFLND